MIIFLVKKFGSLKKMYILLYNRFWVTKKEDNPE